MLMRFAIINSFIIVLFQSNCARSENNWPYETKQFNSDRLITSINKKIGKTLPNSAYGIVISLREQHDNPNDIVALVIVLKGDINILSTNNKIHKGDIIQYCWNGSFKDPVYKLKVGDIVSWNHNIGTKYGFYKIHELMESDDLLLLLKDRIEKYIDDGISSNTKTNKTIISNAKNWVLADSYNNSGYENTLYIHDPYNIKDNTYMYKSAYKQEPKVDLGGGSTYSSINISNRIVDCANEQTRSNYSYTYSIFKYIPGYYYISIINDDEEPKTIDLSKNTVFVYAYNYICSSNKGNKTSTSTNITSSAANLQAVKSITKIAYGANPTDSDSINIKKAFSLIEDKKYGSAIKLLLNDANNGNIRAQQLLGLAYFRNKQYKLAIKWADKAAKADDIRSIYLLGKIYKEGLGNLDAAYYYLDKAAKSGFRPAYDMICTFPPSAILIDSGYDNYCGW